MIKFLDALKNTTIYSTHQLLNTGSDEICELKCGFTHERGFDAARILIQFDTDELKKYDMTTTSFFLNFKIIQKMELDESFEIDILPLSDAWDEGSGRFIDTEHNYPGATWKYRNSNRDVWSGDEFAEIDNGGGSWYSEFENANGELVEIKKSVKIRKRAADLRVDITDFVGYWVDSSLENNGIILKFKSDLQSHPANIKFFSKNTNTIYAPYLEIGIEDYSFNPVPHHSCPPDMSDVDGSLNSGSLDSGSLDSGSLEQPTTPPSSEDGCAKDLVKLSCGAIIPKIKLVRKQYNKSSIERIDVGVRYTYPTKDFTNRMRYSLDNYTTRDMFYSVRDAETEEIIIDFSKFSKISCDTSGHFFYFDFDCLKQGRPYHFLLSIHEGPTQELHPDNRVFNITH